MTTMRDIALAVAQERGFCLDDLLGHCRERPLFLARAEAMLRMRETRKFSRVQIAKFFGRDIQTIHNALAKARIWRHRPAQPPRDRFLAAWSALERECGRRLTYPSYNIPPDPIPMSGAMMVALATSRPRSVGVSTIYDYGEKRSPGCGWQGTSNLHRHEWEAQPNNFGGSGR